MAAFSLGERRGLEEGRCADVLAVVVVVVSLTLTADRVGEEKRLLLACCKAGGYSVSYSFFTGALVIFLEQPCIMRDAVCRCKTLREDEDHPSARRIRHELDLA